MGGDGIKVGRPAVGLRKSCGRDRWEGQCFQGRGLQDLGINAF